MKSTGLGLTADDSRVPWRSTRHAGVHWLPLHPDATDDLAPVDVVVLIRMDPGCGYPPHEHVGDEEVLVLQGGYEDELGAHLAGTFSRYPSGSRHTPVAIGRRDVPIGPGNPACILFAVARGGVTNLPGNDPSAPGASGEPAGIVGPRGRM
jgi:anti-sigma factor ChrR (cupin superfamily)